MFPRTQIWDWRIILWSGRLRNISLGIEVSLCFKRLEESSQLSQHPLSTVGSYGVPRWDLARGQALYELHRFQLSVSQTTREPDQHRMLVNCQWSQQRPRSLQRSRQSRSAPVLRQVPPGRWFLRPVRWMVLHLFLFFVYTPLIKTTEQHSLQESSDDPVNSDSLLNVGAEPGLDLSFG